MEGINSMKGDVWNNATPRQNFCGERLSNQLTVCLEDKMTSRAVGFATGRQDGHMDSSSGSESYYSTDDGDVNQRKPKNEYRMFTLETVDPTLLDITEANFRNYVQQQDKNAIEVTGTFYAQPYNLLNTSQSLPPPYHEIVAVPDPSYSHNTLKDNNYVIKCQDEGKGCQYVDSGSNCNAMSYGVVPQSQIAMPFVTVPQTPMNQPTTNMRTYCKEDAGPGKAQVFLRNSELWAKFHAQTTEMILTKKGRSMFPVLKLIFIGLDPNKLYNISVDLDLVDNHCWKYQKGTWISMGPAQRPPQTGGPYVHPDSPNTGAYWMRTEINFRKLKITNNKKNPGTNVVVSSLRKYQPRINVEEVGNGENDTILQSYVFPETQFVTVTAYQNIEITKLKVDNNPFAKAFRDQSDGNGKVAPNTHAGTKQKMAFQKEAMFMSCQKVPPAKTHQNSEPLATQGLLASQYCNLASSPSSSPYIHQGNFVNQFNAGSTMPLNGSTMAGTCMPIDGGLNTYTNVPMDSENAISYMQMANNSNVFHDTLKRNLPLPPQYNQFWNGHSTA